MSCHGGTCKNILIGVTMYAAEDVHKTQQDLWFTIFCHIFYTLQVEKLLRSVADGDILMVKYLLGWLNDSDDSDDDDVDADAELCHPLCQCSKCATLQRVSEWWGDCL